MKGKKDICVFCNKQIKTEKSKVTTYDDGSAPDTVVATGHAHRACALRNGAEEIDI